MKKISNIKDQLTTICGVVFAISGLCLIPGVAIVLPAVVGTYATAGMALSGGIIAFLTGKNPNGSTKTADQVKEANAGK